MPAEELNREHLRLLLVEDNPDDAFLLERHLRRGGYSLELERVETGAEMLRVLSNSPSPDIVIADYNLPNFSGPAALQLLRSTKLDIPFIMMSGAISEETAVDSMRAGAQDYVTKQKLIRLIPVIERELRDAAARRHKLAAELALEASQARFHRLVEAMPLGLLISDSSGKILYVNGALESELGYPKGSMLSGDLTLDVLASPQLSAYNKLNAPPPSEPFETTCTRADGQRIEALIGVATLNPEAPSEHRQTAAFIADLTIQKKSEEALRRTEKLAVAGRLAASIAHEINNPLEAIINCLHLIEMTELPPDARTYLALAQDELNRVAQITVQTLRFHRQSTHAANTDIHELLETVLTLLKSRIVQQSITVRRQFAHLPLIVARDGEIRQVLANLVGNAIDALPAGGTMTLRTTLSHHWKTNQPGIRIYVADTGVGMSAATLKRISEPFFSTKGVTGTGLGLWVSREIITRHQGTIKVKSRVSTSSHAGGTVFAIFLPFAPQPEEGSSAIQSATTFDAITPTKS